MLVKVILSTYDGENYLEEQLTSLVNQSYFDLKIRVRDDGSKDRTQDILDCFFKKIALGSWYAGKNIGVIDSFFELLSENDDESVAYYAFCDQDDIWKPDKIERAVGIIQNYEENIPVMYCSSYELLNSSTGETITPTGSIIRPSFRNALVENIATGCSIVLNKAARNLIVSKKPRYMLMHDAWCYLVISALGIVLYDNYPSFYYRQHASNVIGAETRFFKKWEKRITSYRKRKGARLLSKQVESFYEIFADQLDEEKIKLINSFLTVKPLMRLLSVLRGDFYRQSSLDNLLFKIMFLIYKV